MLAHDRSQSLESQIATTYHWPSKSTGESGGGGFIFRLSCFYLYSFAYLHLSSSFIPDHHEGTEEQDLELHLRRSNEKKNTGIGIKFQPTPPVSSAVPQHREANKQPSPQAIFSFRVIQLKFYISKPTSYIPAWRTNCQKIRRRRQGTSKSPYPRRQTAPYRSQRRTSSPPGL